MTTTEKGKAPRRPTVKAFQSNHLIGFGGKSSGFDVFNSTEKAEKSQCSKCNPPLVLPKGEMIFCSDCRAEENAMRHTLLENFRRHRKVFILDRECVSCRKPKTGAMMVKRQNICRLCFAKISQSRGAVQSRMISSAVNNQYKRLREVVSYAG